MLPGLAQTLELKYVRSLASQTSCGYRNAINLSSLSHQKIKCLLCMINQSIIRTNFPERKKKSKQLLPLRAASHGKKVKRSLAVMN